MFLKGKAVLGILFLLGLGYTALWYTAGFEAQKSMAATLSGWRDDGYKVEYSSLALSGFPYRIVVEIDGLEVSTRQKGLAVTSEKMMVVSHLWTPSHWVAQASGNTIAVADDMLAWSEGYLEASYRIHDNDKLVIKVDSAGTDDMTWRAPNAGPTLTAWTLLLGRDQSDGASTRGALYEKRTLEFKLFAETNTGSLDITGGVSGPSIRDWSKQELINWRDAGGLLEIDSASIAAPTGGVELKGDLSLDDNLGLLGAASVEAQNPDAILGLLKALNKPTPNESVRQSSLMLQNGLMLLDGFEIMELDPIIR